MKQQILKNFYRTLHYYWKDSKKSDKTEQIFDAGMIYAYHSLLRDEFKCDWMELRIQEALLKVDTRTLDFYKEEVLKKTTPE